MAIEIGLKVETLFAPDDNTRGRFLNFVASANKNINMAIYGFHLPQLMDILLQKHKSGIPVRIVMDYSQEKGKAEQPEVQAMIDAGLDVVIGTSSKHQIMHSKYTLVDDEFVEDGSWNYSMTADKQGNTMNIVSSKERAALFLDDFEKKRSWILANEPLYNQHRADVAKIQSVGTCSLAPHTVIETDLPYPKIPITDGMQLMHVIEEWNEGSGNGVVVCVIDTGVDASHPFLQGKIIGFKDFTPANKADAYDDHGHGTHVSGTVLMVAPNAKVVSFKVLAGDGHGDTSWVTAAINETIAWRGPNGEKISVINMSLGSPGDDPTMHQAIINATNAGIVVVVAAGNDGFLKDQDMVDYPGRYQEVVAVAAVRPTGNDEAEWAWFSSAGPEIDLAAPGFNVYSTWPGGGWANLMGTSMASPHIAGASANIIERFTKKFRRPPTVDEVFGVLLYDTVEVQGIDKFNNLIGAGFFTFLPFNRYTSKQKKTVKYFIGEPAMYVNDVKVALDVAPEIKEPEGRTMAPARFVAEPGGGIVTWLPDEMSPDGQHKSCVRIDW